MASVHGRMTLRTATETDRSCPSRFHQRRPTQGQNRLTSMAQEAICPTLSHGQAF